MTPATKALSTETTNRRRSRYALASFLGLAGVAHFASPGFFDDLIPGWLGEPRAWTYGSGVVELACAGLLANPRTRQLGGWVTAATFVAVYPGNITMAVRAGMPTDTEGIVAWVRLPFQVPLVLWALSHTADRPLRERVRR